MDHVDGNGNTLTHYAVMTDDPGLVRMFFRRGMNMIAKNRFGQTPRDIAVQRQKLSTAAELELIELEVEIARFRTQSSQSTS